MTSIREVISSLESFAPPHLQEAYDNAGLIVGDEKTEVSSVLICLDSTEAVVEEAMQKNCNLIVAHHPILFKGIKQLTGSNYVERTIIKAIKNDIAIYAIHTNLDNVKEGVNKMIGKRLGLKNLRILDPKEGLLLKLVTFSPKDHTENVRKALFDAGAGTIGAYDSCAFTSDGEGQFKPGKEADPYLGTVGEIEKVNEDRIEVVLEKHKWSAVYKALTTSHPYEDVAYHTSQLTNIHQDIGSGMIGEMEPMSTDLFLRHLKDRMETGLIKHTTLAKSTIRTVAICGGAGSFLIKKAIQEGADAFITSDVKYHEFFDAEDRLLLADIGHYESEVFTKDLIYDLLRKNFTTFAVNLAGTNTNPISYF